MSKRVRRNFAPDQKAAAVLRHLQGKEPVSKICEDLQIIPNQFYEWQKTALSNLSSTFTKVDKKAEKRIQDKIDRLEQKSQKKDSVIAELLQDHIALKKSLGEY